nr:hypothetical protein [uncultured Rhodopila sp.]
MGMTIEFPQRLSKKNLELLARCNAAANALREQCAEIDTSNLVDVVEALESMASTVRRARASAHNRK